LLCLTTSSQAFGINVGTASVVLALPSDTLAPEDVWNALVVLRALIKLDAVLAFVRVARPSDALAPEDMWDLLVVVCFRVKLEDVVVFVEALPRRLAEKSLVEVLLDALAAGDVGDRLVFVVVKLKDALAFDGAARIS